MLVVEAALEVREGGAWVWLDWVWVGGLVRREGTSAWGLIDWVARYLGVMLEIGWTGDEGMRGRGGECLITHQQQHDAAAH